ncbi:beta strand repeat-containing protein [Terracidiphilus gabretensis]|uniref:beta strand repeat-containing protein n=1 Tax=Terracidiphilus gabretensis TaxID=1577687 RepID=UPI00071BC9AE|nr:hypothetical protein [Terracidiphilus gabretensis]
MHTFKRQISTDNQAIEAARPGRLRAGNSHRDRFRENLIRAGQWLTYWLLWLGMVWAAFAQGVTTTTVQGTVYLANGQPAAGTLQISWPSFTTAAGQAVAAGRTMVTIGADGFVSVNLSANQGAYPGGLFYTVIYNLSDGSVHTEYWTIPAAAQATIGGVRAQIMPAAQAVQAVNKAYVDQAIAAAQASDLTASGGTLTGPLYLSGDPTTPLQAADKHYVDGQFALALPLAGGAATGPLTAVQLGAVYQVDQFPGTDIGAKLQACVNNLNSTFGGVCDARNFPGTLTIASNVTISTPNSVIDLPCATITTSAQFIVTAGTRNVVVHGCGFQGGSTASGTQGGTVWVYTGTSNAFQIGDMTGATNTPGFYMHDININAASAGANAAGIYFERAQEVRLDGIYLNGNGNVGQMGVVLNGAGNYAGGTFIDVYINAFGIGWQLTGDNVGNFANASTFVKTHVVCPTNSGTPIVGTVGVNVIEGDGNTWSGGDVESCFTMFHLGPNAINNTVNGLRNENSTVQYQADSGSKENAVFTGGTLFTGQLIDNGSRNSFWDAFHRTANGINGDTYASQQDATLTNHLRIGTGTGNERGMENEIVTDFGARWEEGYSDAMGTGFQTWALADRINNINRVSVGQYLSTTANVVTNIVLNNGGCYTTNTPPTITISGGAGTGATAAASMAASTSLSCNGGAGFQVSSVAVSASGSGYTSAPTVTFAGTNQLTAPNSVAEIVSQGSTNNQTVMNSAGTGAIVLNGSNNAGTGGVVIGSGGATSTAIATISNTGNAQFTGSLSVNGTSLSAGTLSVKNAADTEVDYYLQPGLTATQKGSFTYKDYTGTSQWYLLKDASNNWALNSAPGNIDILKAYQNTNSGDTYLDTSNATGHIRLNYETGAGAETDIYSGGSANLDAAFQSPTAIKLPGLAATSGKYCVQVDNSGYLSNTGTACGTGTGSGGTGTINSGTNGQIAVYSSTGTTIAGVTNLSIAAGGTGATTAATALTGLGAQAALPGVSSNGSSGLNVTGSVAASAVSSNTSVSSANNVISIMAPPYNAACNLVQFSSGSISLNSAILTGAGFTTALVGRTIIVWGAGANNGTTANPNYGPLITSVASFQGATQITLSATASATVPNNSNNPSGNFEIGTDDTSAVQAAYNAAAAAKATLLFPATQGNNSCLIGTIDLSAGSKVNSAVPIQGQGSVASVVTGLPGQDVFQWPDGRPISSSYSYVKGLQITVDTSIDISGPSGSYSNRVTGLAANGTGSLTALSAAVTPGPVNFTGAAISTNIAPGPVNFTGAAISTSSDGTFDELTVATPATNGGNFNLLPSWMVIGQPVSIPGIGLNAAITSVAAGANGASQVTFAPAYSGAASNLNGTWGAGIAPPWYIGNCGFAVPGSNGATIGGPQMMFEDVTFRAAPGTPAFANHSCAMFFQQPPYRSRFTRITAQNLYYGYIEALPTSNNQITWTPDTATYHDVDFSTQIPFVQYAGNHRIIDGLNIYSANHPLALGPFFLNGPLNGAGNSTVTHLYHECWSPNSGENQRWQGSQWTILAGSLTQCGGPYVAWQANQSFVTDVLIGGPAIATPATAGLQLSGSGNTFVAANLALNANNSLTALVNDTGYGNTVTANNSNFPLLPMRANLPRCIPGEFDGSFLSGFAGSPFTSRCGLVLDYSTSQVNGPGASSVSYAPSVPGDGNPAPGYWYTSTPTGAVVQINAAGEPWAVGMRVPQTSQMYLVVGGKVSTAGSQSFVVYDNTAGSIVAACSFTFNAANTFSIHGQKGAPDACAFSTASVPVGDVLIVRYAPAAALGAESVGFMAFVPAETDPKTLANGSTATTQTTTDASTQVATDAFVHSAIASQTGYQLTEWTSGGQRSSPGVAFSSNLTGLYSFVLPGSLSASKVSYTPSVADASSSDFYDIGIYNASGGLVCHLGNTPGSIFAPNTNTVTLSFTSACGLFGGIRYYLGITASSATATLASVGAVMVAVGGSAPSVGSSTTGGALNSAITPPADNWSAYVTMPQIALHN